MQANASFQELTSIFERLLVEKDRRWDIWRRWQRRLGLQNLHTLITLKQASLGPWKLRSETKSLTTKKNWLLYYPIQQKDTNWKAHDIWWARDIKRRVEKK